MYHCVYPAGGGGHVLYFLYMPLMAFTKPVWLRPAEQASAFGIAPGAVKTAMTAAEESWWTS